MKKFLIILLSLSSLYASAQKIDSLSILSPKGEILKTVSHPSQYEQVLDSLGLKLKLKEFNIVKYYNDGKVVQCKVRKKKNKV